MARAWMEGDLESLANDDAREGAREMAALPFVQPARLSSEQTYALAFCGRYLWALAKDMAKQNAARGYPVKPHAMTMRDAWITWRLGRGAQENGGIVQ